MKTFFVCFLLLIGKLSAKPVDNDQSIVVTTEAALDNSEQDDDNLEDLRVPKIYNMHIHSKIENRYANTTVTSKVRNLAKSAKETTFFVVLPDSAFITGFIMEIGGKNYTAHVQEKKKAQETYNRAVQSGVGAAHVAVSARDSNKFTVTINIEPESKANFYLTYEELLKRIDGYEMVINIHPKQPVPQLEVQIEISESSPLKYVKAPPIRSGNDVRPGEGDLDPRAVINKVNETYATITFKPSVERQKQLAGFLGTKETEGLAGQFVIQYEVERENNGGEILLKDGHFVHFFSPDEMKQLPKYVMFVLDTSGSMYGEKIEQLKQAMKKILGDLKEEDAFNVIEFNSKVKVWDIEDNHKSTEHRLSMLAGTGAFYDNLEFPQSYLATETNIAKAKEVINQLQADGGTEIMNALNTTIYLHNKQIKRDPEFNKQPLIIFLTDGQGYLLDKILKEISERNTRNIPIFSLSFGVGADQSFLRKISLQNYAFSRHIYEGTDASIQLENFYKRVSSPLLKDVHFKYTQGVQQVTRSKFPIFFRGAECVITGKIDKFDDTTEVQAVGFHGPVHLKPSIKQATGELERLWAYLTIKQLLENSEADKNNADYEKKALDLALKYSFVTPVSSLVVVKPGETKSVDAEAADVPSPFPRLGFGMHASHSFARPSHRGSASYPAPAVGYTARGHVMRPSHSFARPSHGRGASYRGLEAPAGTHISPNIGWSTTASNKITQLSWIRPILNVNNNTISLPNGNYKLGYGARVNETNECNNAYNSTIGHCTLLHNCNHVMGQNLITTLEVYLQHFCNIQDYAGVCCPNSP